MFKTAIHPKWIYRFNAVSIHILVNFFVGIGKLIPKFTWKFKGAGTAKAILNKTNTLEGLTLGDINVNHKVAVTKFDGDK